MVLTMNDFVIIDTPNKLGVSELKYMQSSTGHYCGYAVLSPSHIFTQLYDKYGWDFIRKYWWYQPHGGVTYDELDSDGNLVLGFDQAHIGDDESGINDNPKYVTNELTRFGAELMRQQGGRSSVIQNRIDEILFEHMQLTILEKEKIQ